MFIMRQALMQCLIAVLLTGVAVGEELGSISGTVEDAHGAPVADATVVAEPLVPFLVQSSRTLIF
jgi:hypothetical protein